MIEEAAPGGVVTKESHMCMNPSAGQLVNNSSSSSAAAAAAATAAAVSSSLSSSSSSLLHSGSLLCPRCNSSNTKFCYYNNYSRAQPRHFCRTCRRYWTQGGVLRNVPIGGTSRRPKPKSTNLILSGGLSMLSPTILRAVPYCRTSAHHRMALLWPNCGPNQSPWPSIGPIDSLFSEVPNYYYSNHLNTVISNLGGFASASASAFTTTTISSSLAAATASRSASSSISESTPFIGGEFAYCLNSAFTWPHLPTTYSGSSTFP